MCIEIAAKKDRPSTSQVILSLTNQVPDQWKFAGQVPEWSDCEEPAVAVTGNLPILT